MSCCRPGPTRAFTSRHIPCELYLETVHQAGCNPKRRSSEGIVLTRCRLFALLSGTADLTLPATGEQMHIEAGVNGLIVASDITGEGHITEYPMSMAAIALQLPFEGGVVPNHAVVSNTPCSGDDGGGRVTGVEQEGGQRRLLQQ